MEKNVTLQELWLLTQFVAISDLFSNCKLQRKTGFKLQVIDVER